MNRRSGRSTVALLWAASLIFAQNADHKIDRALLAQLGESAEASAPFFVIF